MRARMVVCWRAASFFAAARRESGISTVVFIHITIHGDPFRCKTGLFRSSENDRVAPGKERYSDGSLADGAKVAAAGATARSGKMYVGGAGQAADQLVGAVAVAGSFDLYGGDVTAAVGQHHQPPISPRGGGIT